jgi:hypothetical protein
MLFASGDRCHVIFDPDNKVYTLHIESDGHGNVDKPPYIELWAIPLSFTDSTSPEAQFQDIYKFKARMKARDPRKGKDYDTQLIELNCVLIHEGP